jgi:hypothetical protein
VRALLVVFLLAVDAAGGTAAPAAVVAVFDVPVPVGLVALGDAGLPPSFLGGIRSLTESKPRASSNDKIM